MRERYEAAKRLLNTRELVTDVPYQIKWQSGDTFQYRKLTRRDGQTQECVCSLCISDASKTELGAAPGEQDCSVSPDGRYQVIARENNLFLNLLSSGEQVQITWDGAEDWAYGAQGGTCELIKQSFHHSHPPAGVLWSQDSRKFVTYRLDERKVKPLSVVQSVTGVREDPRPILHQFKYSLPNDPEIATAELFIYDVELGSMTKVDFRPLNINYTPPVSADGMKVCWTGDSTRIYFTALDRYFQHAELVIADSRTGRCSVVWEEHSDRFLFYDSYGESDGSPCYNFTNYVFSRKPYALWQSPRSGSNHLYLIDTEQRSQVCAVTSGPYEVVSILGVDEERETVYFTARGLPQCSDPYYLCLCSVHCDGTQFRLHTPEDACHQVVLSPDFHSFVDVYSRVDLPPTAKVRSTGSDWEVTFEHADISRLMEAGYILPKRICYPSEDGTPLYGLLILPPETGEKQPLIDYIYGGVQSCNVPKEFTWYREDGREAFGGLQSLAKLGFIGLILDGTGTPKRGTAFHQKCYRNLQCGAGIDDHAAVLRRLALDYPRIDMDRIGIWGSSGGGYATFRAMCRYPGLYRTGVSVAGNHNMRNYCASWVERYNGPYDPQVYDAQDNTLLAEKLEGKLLLIHGDLDDNVNISNTMSVVHSLVEANKDFDLLIVPNAFHDVAKLPYVIRRRWDYFVKNLLGTEPPKEFPME